MGCFRYRYHVAVMPMALIGMTDSIRRFDVNSSGLNKFLARAKLFGKRFNFYLSVPESD